MMDEARIKDEIESARADSMPDLEGKLDWAGMYAQDCASLLAELEQAEAERGECEWVENLDDGYWETSCGGAFVLNEDAKLILFRDTLQLENLDRNELEASIHALSLALAEYSLELLSYAKK